MPLKSPVVTITVDDLPPRLRPGRGSRVTKTQAAAYMELMAGEVALEMKRIVEESFELQRSPGGVPWLKRYPGQQTDRTERINYAGLARDFASGANPPPHRFTSRPAGIDSGALSKSFEPKIEGRRNTTSPRKVSVMSKLVYAEAFHSGGDFSVPLAGVKRRANAWLKNAPLSGMEKGKVKRALGLTSERVRRQGGLGQAGKTHYRGVMVRRPLVDFPTSALRSIKYAARRRVDVADHTQLEDRTQSQLRGVESEQTGRGLGGTQFQTTPGLGVGEVDLREMGVQERYRAIERNRRRGQWLQRSLQAPTSINHEFLGR